MNKITKFILLFPILLFLIGCQEQKVTIIFDSNGGSDVEQAEAVVGQEVNLPTPHQIGYSFVGWFDGDDHKYPDTITATNNLNLVAKWEIIRLVIRFEYEDASLIKEETIDYGSDVIAPTPKNIPGYSFVGWSKNLTQLTNNETITALYERLSYQVTFFDYDDTKIDAQFVLHGDDAIAPVDPVREGYIFIGWNQIYTEVTRNLSVKARYDEEAHGMIYAFDGESYVVIGYEGTNNEVLIPSTYNELPVVGIGEKAFLNNYAITKVTISEGIVSIGTSAFSGCIELMDVLLPNSLTLIGEEAFNSCSRLAQITIGAQTIGEAAFSGCTGIKNITLLDTVVSIGGWVFWGNSGLTSLFIPDSVSEIGKHAFSWCTKLLTIYTPSTNVSRLQTLLDGAENIYVKYSVAALD